MSSGDQAAFLQGLAEALNSKDVALPSFPDVVVQIRTALEDPSCDAERIATVVRTDPMLVSRLLKSANSAFHNRAGIEIVDLHLAIGRLGFETVRNSANTLAVEQIFKASQFEDLKDRLRAMWNNSIELSSMSFVLAQKTGRANPDNSFLSGLLHHVGQLYIVTQAKEYPEFLGDTESVEKVVTDWSSTVGKSIVESWGFSEDIAASLDFVAPSDDGNADGSASLADVVTVAHLLLGDAEATLAEQPPHVSVGRLGLGMDAYAGIYDSYEKYLQSMRQSVSG